MSIGARQSGVYFLLELDKLGMVVPLFLQAEQQLACLQGVNSQVGVRTAKQTTQVLSVMSLSTSFSTKSGMGERIFAIIAV